MRLQMVTIIVVGNFAQEGFLKKVYHSSDLSSTFMRITSFLLSEKFGLSLSQKSGAL